MRKPIVFLFSGQGSQYYHMGKELYRENTVFRHWMLKLDNIVYQNVGFSIVEEIYNKTKSEADKFDHLLYTHPAIFMVEYALAQVLIESGIEPDYVLGASLGEIVSAAVAGVFSLEESLECLLRQAELVKKQCQDGGMIAIVHDFDLYYQSAIISHNSELAAVNYASHFVIAGDREKISNIKDHLKTSNIFSLILPVQYGFHSRNIDPIGGEYKSFLSRFSFKKPVIPIISCQLSDYVTKFSPEYFWDVVRRPIYFQKTIYNLEKDYEFTYIDLGPSGTLANFVKNNLSEDSSSQYCDILSIFGQEVKKLERLIQNIN